ncbi:methylthioribulose-1-phosphate dehydratase [Calothrix sp. NIES-4071]|nr:methylthioribulose-1-phosphate dehydratase [Calothrix sp. NIES-4071]BAZ59979.1 methylthioribulose-1-phosphate dehydratase [Calothrix sp. NIES-4105]
MKQELLETVSINYDPRPELIGAASYFHAQGWMLGTAGNLSAKMPDNSFWITASGKSKGKLTHDDFVRVYSDGSVEAPRTASIKPSAETSIHSCIYELFPEAQACYHVHSVDANLVSHFVDGDELPLPPLEMIKGLGVWEENPNCIMPLFDNHFKVPQIADDIKTRFLAQKPQIPALLIRNHGVTVWANSLETARNYIEITEFVFRYIVAAKKAGI